ncbi:MAG TPA: ComEC/Rec2 family competence protein, partial [bacterium]|nr:ComEC/Rec2 family competence protein [bacterium]
GIYLISRQPSLEKVAEEKRGFFSVLFRLKDNLKKIIDKSMPEPEAGLANALILGYKNTVSREYLDLFSEIGVSHMIAISGTHITIMAMIWQKIMGIFFRRPKLILTISFLSFYVLLTGSSAAALRSLVMGILALVIMSQKGKQNGTWLLIFSAAFMLLINPLWLTADLGFQLSYLAMIALIYIYPWLNSYFVNWPKQRWAQGVWEVFVLTIASQLLTAPLIAVNFGRFSVIAPLANILLLWIFPFLMATLLGGLLLAALLPPLVKIFFLPAYFGLLYIFSAAEIIARVPLATVDWRWNWGGAGLFYSGFFLVYYFFNKQKNRA